LIPSTWLAICTCATACARTTVYLCAYKLALIACLAVLAADGVLTFLAARESMALLCYVLTLHRPRSEQAAGGAFWFLALHHRGGYCLRPKAP
jgi:formate hydrogenlyase subunit 3/multisubunit Na+/H+ antiporter MnhD subunit